MLNLKNYRVCVILTWSIYCFITLFPALHSDLENQSHNHVTVKNGRLGVTGGTGRSGWEPHRKSYLESIVTVWLFSQPGEKPNSGCCYLIGLRTPAGEKEKEKPISRAFVRKKKKISSDCVTSQTNELD